VLRAWERRYGIVSPDRTASGYRQFDDAAVDRIRTMRRLVDDGWSPSAAAAAIVEGTVAVSPSGADEPAFASAGAGSRASLTAVEPEPLDLAHAEPLARFFDALRPEGVLHLAAQPGVRYSLENPASYVQSNLVAFARAFHLDDAGAQVGEQARAVRAGEDAGEIEDGEAGEQGLVGVAGDR